ncbi:peptidase domain-containing ABC transporter [Exilibacterium tricleocarpae]|uniref:Peptidase domain-containing ABC transporter n=1 Tax=Exilibacterium tricleocarpae TaxID=2591008 RepID=A0A545TZL7_9GAMM|nr:peptidase domain-containing ABC transporter [Exilibacterium tricleocarpae]TQV82662.1 peptidase domain-containing ABC transporter [Exilibacterium tricleocarpae]
MFKDKIKGFPYIQQPSENECGTTCLAMIFKYYGYYDVRTFLSQKAQVNIEGIDLYTLSELAEGFGFESDGYQIHYDNLPDITLPCIAHYRGNHFVVIYKVSSTQVWIADPAIGRYTESKKEFQSHWNGIILALEPTTEIFQHNELTELADIVRKKRQDIISRFYLSHFRSAKKLLLQVLAATLFLQLLGLALPFFTQTIIDQALVNDNKKLLYAILAGMVTVFFSQVLITYGRNILVIQFAVTFERNFFSRFFDHFMRLKQSYFDRHRRESFITLFQENLKVRQALNPTILEGVIDFAFVGTYLAALYYYSLTIGLVATAFAVLYLLLTVIFFPKLRDLENLVFAENIETMGQFLDTLLGIQTVRLLGIEKIKFWRWKNKYTRALNKVLETEKLYINVSTLLDGIYYLSQAAIYWLGAYLAFSGTITIGAYIAIITIYVIVINALKRVTQLGFMFTDLSVSFERLNDVLIEDEVDNSLENKVMLTEPIHMRLENVYFKYHPQQEHYALDNINLDIPPGQFVGVVGRNGSGKTTLVRLLTKLYDDYEGKILFNQCELRNTVSSQVHKKVAIIPQDIYLFDGTLRENIIYGNMEATDEEVLEAVAWAELLDFVEDQYLRLNVRIGQGGIGLSGGQRLKVAFARLFLSNPDVIILDEASSALDMETEKVIMSRLMERFKGKTILSIAHRLHTLKTADTILVIDKGAIVEQGSHQQLLARQGQYHNLVNTYINY